jgi:hypothetical protein
MGALTLILAGCLAAAEPVPAGPSRVDELGPARDTTEPQRQSQPSASTLPSPDSDQTDEAALQGSLSEVGTRSITVLTAEGEHETLGVDAHSAFLVGGQRVDLRQLHVGDGVRVSFDRRQGERVVHTLTAEPRP